MVNDRRIKKLNLIKVKAFTIRATVDEWGSENKGMYLDKKTAQAKSFGIGWYGSNGEVIELDNIYEDSEGILYTVECFGKPTEVEADFVKKTRQSIFSKLSADELEYLGLKDEI